MSVVLEPVIKSIRVPAPPARAFLVFTARMGQWWPKSHHVGPAPPIDIVVEPRVGGRLYSLHEGGVEVVFGHVLAWEPPHLLRFSWEISARWQPDARVSSQVQVRFTGEGQETRVDLRHEGFAALGAEDGATMRNNVDNGWPGILGVYLEYLRGR